MVTDSSVFSRTYIKDFLRRRGEGIVAAGVFATLVIVPPIINPRAPPNIYHEPGNRQLAAYDGEDVKVTGKFLFAFPSKEKFTDSLEIIIQGQDGSPIKGYTYGLWGWGLRTANTPDPKNIQRVVSALQQRQNAQDPITMFGRLNGRTLNIYALVVDGTQYPVLEYVPSIKQ